MVEKKPVKKAVKKKALGSPAAAEAVLEVSRWRALARELAVAAGWSKKDLERVFGE